MNRHARTIVLGLALGAAAAVCGCEIEPDGPYVETGVYAEPAPAGYYYGPGYYDDGYYRGNYWLWRDRGRWYREPRAWHERRERDWRGDRGREWRRR